MKTYQIVNSASGADLGTYEAESARGALDVMSTTAGYKDWIEACRVAPVEDGEIRVYRIEPGEGVAVSVFGVGAADYLVHDCDVPDCVWKGLGCDWPRASAPESAASAMPRFTYRTRPAEGAHCERMNSPKFVQRTLATQEEIAEGRAMWTDLDVYEGEEAEQVCARYQAEEQS
jgi:hypothetical protein